MISSRFIIIVPLLAQIVFFTHSYAMHDDSTKIDLENHTMCTSFLYALMSSNTTLENNDILFSCYDDATIQYRVSFTNAHKALKEIKKKELARFEECMAEIKSDETLTENDKRKEFFQILKTISVQELLELQLKEFNEFWGCTEPNYSSLDSEIKNNRTLIKVAIITKNAPLFKSVCQEPVNDTLILPAKEHIKRLIERRNNLPCRKKGTLESQ